MIELTEAEVEAITTWHGPETYTCACDSRCPSLPCNNDRDDLVTTVQRIIDARLAPIRALADEWEAKAATFEEAVEAAWAFDGVLDDLRAALDAIGADLSASQDHDGAEGQGERERADDGDDGFLDYILDRSCPCGPHGEVHP